MRLIKVIGHERVGIGDRRHPALLFKPRRPLEALEVVEAAMEADDVSTAVRALVEHTEEYRRTPLWKVTQLFQDKDLRLELDEGEIKHVVGLLLMHPRITCLDGHLVWTGQG